MLFPPEEFELSERFAPPGFEGNYWGPEATEARAEGKLPPVPMTPHMARWDRWGRQVLRDGDIVFRMGDARLLHGYFPMSRFLANCSNSRFSHTGIIAIEKDGPVVYDTTRPAVAREPFCVWVLDNVGCIGVKRLRPEFRGAIPQVLAYCRKVYQEQVPFDYELGLDDSALYCIEMTQKAFMSAGIELSKPIAVGDMERAPEFPVACSACGLASRYALDHPLDFDKPGLFPGERATWDLVGEATHDRRPADLFARISRPQHRRTAAHPGTRGARLAPGQKVSDFRAGAAPGRPVVA